MAQSVIIFGKSGSGKSRSLIGFKEDEITLINTIGKLLPFSKKFKYSATVSDPDVIKASLKKMPTKVAVIDDAGYLMTTLFMRSHGKGDQFKMYNDLADMMWNLFVFVKDELPQDVMVYWMFHEETSDFGETKIRTIGKLLDQKITLEGMVTICLHCVVKNGKHIFLTQSDGTDISKSPEGLWEDLEIPNDLKAVDSAIRKYWGL